VALGVLASVLFGASGADAQPRADAVDAAVDWLVGQQQPDGGFDGVIVGAETPDATLALAESAQTSAEWSTRAAVERVEAARSSRGRTPIDAVRELARDQDSAVVRARIVALVGLPLGLDDLVGSIELRFDGLTFPVRIDVGAAAVATGQELPEGFVDDVRAAQQANGGWNEDGDPDGEVVDARLTGAVVDLLVAAGVDPAGGEVHRALRMLVESQRDDGGWAAPGGEGSDVLATAGAVRAIRAAGYDPAASCWRSELGEGSSETTPLDHLLAQQRDDGSFPGRPQVLATAEAVHALSGRWLPAGRGSARCTGDDGGGLPFAPSLLVLGAIGFVGVAGGIRIIRGGGGTD
jgi:hypothetical protein